MIVAVEGIDCAGKGELCPRLASALGAVLYKTPPENMRAEQDRINATASDIDHYRYFVRVVQQASEEIAILARTRSVVIDRYWMTTVVYHRVMGIPAELQDIGEITMQDVTVYLTVSPDVQSVRMGTRGMSPGDRRMDGKQHLIRRGYEEIMGQRADVITVDTTSMGQDEVLGFVLAEMR